MSESTRRRVFALVIITALLIPTVAGALPASKAGGDAEARSVPTGSDGGWFLFDWVQMLITRIFGESATSDMDVGVDCEGQGEGDEDDDDEDQSPFIDPNG